MYMCVGIGAHTPHAVHFCQGTSVLLFFRAPVCEQKQPLSRAHGARAQAVLGLNPCEVQPC